MTRLFAWAVAALLLFPSPTFGASKAVESAAGTFRDAGKNTGLSQTDLTTTISGMINTALGLTGIILLVIIIYAGFLWMTAQGNEEQVTKAKNILKNAVIGMVLVFASYAIAWFVTSLAVGDDTSVLIQN